MCLKKSINNVCKCGAPKVSIIIGCYNVEKWLCEGRLGDIYSQTYQDWELILVDDGSTDATATLLDAEASADSRIKVVHKKNGGLGSARNAGLDIATGDYVWSFDLDDHVDSDCIEYCVKEAEKRQVDVLMFGFYAVTPSLGTVEKVQLKETMVNSSDELRDVYLERLLFVPNGNGFFWNKFYRRSFIETNRLRFGNQRIQQDECFNLIAYMHLEKCYISAQVFYHYYVYDVGNTRSKFIPERFDIYKSVRDNFERLKSFWGIMDNRFEDYLNDRFYKCVLQCMGFNILHHDCHWTKEEKRQEMNRVMSNPFTIRAFSYAGKKYNDIENELYRYACVHKSLCMLSTLNTIFSIMRRVKKYVRIIKNR